MRIKVIVNPNAGKRTIQRQLERIMGKLLLDGIAAEINITRTTGRGHAAETAAALAPGEYDLIIVCGGDGTVNEVINGLMQGGGRIPIAILAAGTSNDFAFSMGLPDEAEAFCRMVEGGRYEDVDIGCANGRYFINVAAFGMFTAVAHTTDQEQKNLLGKLAYYLQVIKDAPQELAASIPLTIESEEYTAEGNYHVCLVANSMSVGSMRRLMSRAEVNDGKFDVLLMKKKKLLPTQEQLAALQPAELLERIKNSIPNKDPVFVYFQTSRVSFSSPEGDSVSTDLDGEALGGLPLTVEVSPRALRLLIPNNPAKTGLRGILEPLLEPEEKPE